MPVPILTVEQIREWEQATWASGQTEAAVIQQAGERVARRALRMTGPEDRILVLAGKGHNGDDARAAAACLPERQVTLIDATDPEPALAELGRAEAPSAHLLIDGLFGIGLNRPLSGSWSALIEGMNQTGTPILAIDVPSGLDAQTGHAQGAAIRAAWTVTLAAPKSGLLLPSAWEFVGRLEVAPDIGLVPCPFSSSEQWTLPEDFQRYPPPRQAHSHKGSFGHALILAGSLGFHGAAVLAARGALCARPGLVTVITTPETYLPVAGQLQAAMVRPWRAGDPFPENISVILAGPGLAAADLAPAFRDQIQRLWIESPIPMVVDATALDWISGGPDGALRVVTPHPGEAARLLGCTASEVQAGRFSAVRRLSEKLSGAWVVLKGHQTVIGRRQGDLWVNSSGGPDLAQGGSGDVLAGFLTGLLAQPELQSDPGRALRYAVWRHGQVADGLSERRLNWTIADLLAAFSETTCV